MSKHQPDFEIYSVLYKKKNSCKMESEVHMKVLIITAYIEGDSSKVKNIAAA